MEDKFYWIWLSKIKGLGPIKLKKLLKHFKTAQEIWRADREELNKVSGIGPVLSSKITNSKLDFSAEAEAKKLKKHNVKLVTWKNKCYPKLLKEIYAPPLVLYYQGSLKGLEEPCLAVVGTRSCTRYGSQVAYKASSNLAQQGFSIISGLARGIDTKSHQGALQTGITYAILGSGLDNIYPPENKLLAAEIAQKGAVLTAYPVGTKPQKENFPARNRIISGLSLGTLVVEAPNKSGALITANFALEQGREVFAIPGDITKRQSVGTNKLIQVGAKLVQNAEDVTEELALEKLSLNKNRLNEKSFEKTSCSIDLTKQQELVYQLLTTEAQQFEKILIDVKLKSEQLIAILSQLEIIGLVEQLSGKRFRLLN
ncbi:MAG: DNA-processing protein DprA [Bacillota bacterium]